MNVNDNYGICPTCTTLFIPPPWKKYTDPHKAGLCPGCLDDAMARDDAAQAEEPPPYIPTRGRCRRHVKSMG